MTSCVEKHYLQRTDQFLPKMSCKTDTYLEETLKDIDEFIQAELGFAPLSSIEPSTAVELHDLSSFLQTRETFNGSVVGHTLGEHNVQKYIVFAIFVCSFVASSSISTAVLNTSTPKEVIK